ncbi:MULTISPECIES: hypothetical protein [Roseobacteraceae]|uniref:hypothetical protein n=1 Tax=Roseobacteraceae TaxID=2854170 RepID=UPI002036FA96|nr:MULTISPECIES: hypothetical protein [Roseobacteraceae]
MTPWTNAWFTHAAEGSGLPSGAVYILGGAGHEAGAAQNVVPSVLELDGKSAALGKYPSCLL